MALGIPEPDVGKPWETKGDVCSTLAKFESRRFLDLYEWMGKADVLLDGRDPAALAQGAGTMTGSRTGGLSVAPARSPA